MSRHQCSDELKDFCNKVFGGCNCTDFPAYKSSFIKNKDIVSEPDFDPNACQCKDEKGNPLNKCDECPR